MRFYSDIETCSTLEGARAQQTDFTGAIMTAIVCQAMISSWPAAQKRNGLAPQYETGRTRAACPEL